MTDRFGPGMKDDGSVKTLSPEEYQKALALRNAEEDESFEDDIATAMGVSESDEDDDLED